MNLSTAIKKIPWKHRNMVLAIFKTVSKKIADEAFDRLSNEKLQEFENINKNDRKALSQFVLNNIPDLEQRVISETILYVENSYASIQKRF